MLKHYLITALRNFGRFKLATTVNIFCLALGLACVAMTYVVIDYLSNSDRSFANASRTYVISENYYSDLIKKRFDDMPLTGPVVARFVEADFPQIEAVARRTQGAELPVSHQGTASFARISFADPKLLDIIDFPFVAGAYAAALRYPRSAIITQTGAARIFGRQEAVGKVLRIANQDVTITGVIAAIPKPTGFDFEILASMDVNDSLLEANGIAVGGNSAKIEDWWWLKGSYITYVLLPENGAFTPAALKDQLKAFATRHLPDTHGNFTLGFGLVSLGSVGINTLNAVVGGSGVSVSIATIGYVLSALVLMIGCVNYANLATAMAAGRGKEVGLRKILGSTRTRVLGQHLFEAALTAGAAMMLVVVLIALMAPLVKQSGFDITTQVLMQPRFAGFLVFIVAATTVIGGLYPSLLLSSVRPVQALRAGSVRAGPRFVAALLVAMQFAASSFLLILALIMQAQNEKILNVGQTFVDDPTVVLSTGTDTAQMDLEALRSRLLSSPHIRSVSASSAVPMVSAVSPLSVSRSAEPGVGVVVTSDNRVSYDFFQTLGIKLLAGRDFSRARGDDITDVTARSASRRTHVVVDARLASQLGWSAPELAVGNTIYVSTASTAFPMEVIGVVESKPLNLMGLGSKSGLYELSPSRAVFPVIRVSKSDIVAALQHLDSVWNELSPDVPQRRQFIDALFDQAYERLLGYNRLVAALAVLGSAIALMGLLGMVIYATGLRMHEMGVRKTLGASSKQIFGLLIRDFSKPIVAANLLAWPLAFLAAQIYLNFFTDRARITPLPFIDSLALLLSIAWLVIGSRVWRAARANPARVLRYE